MKFLSVFFIFPIFLGCAQSNDELVDSSSEGVGKTVVISAYSRSSSSGCESKAIRISKTTVEFDNCYDEDLSRFKSTKSIELSDESIYHSIFNTSVKDWRIIEDGIDELSTIDAGLPFIIDIMSEGKSESIILLRISNYNEHDRAFMNEIEAIFDNWDLIMSHID